MELKIIDNKGQESGSVELNETRFKADVSPTLLHEVVTAYLANKRSGTHSTLTKAQVSGGGIKPWKQKGTGRARSGSIRSPLWRHGGIIFGPQPRDYRQDLPKTKRKLAFKLAVQYLLQDSRLQVVEPITIPEPKTKHVAAVYKKWEAPADSLFVVDKVAADLQRAARNIDTVRLLDVSTLNTYECLKARKVFITQAALEQLTQRVVGKENSN